MRARRGLRAVQRDPRHVGPGPGAGGHARDALRLPRPRLPVDQRPPGQRRDAARRLPEPRQRLDRRRPDPRDRSRSSSSSSSASGCATTAPAASCTRSAPTPRAPGWPACARSGACWPPSCWRRARRPRRRAVHRALRHGRRDRGRGYELTVVAAAVVGGVAIFGGTGTVYGAALGALLLTTITSSLIVLRVAAFWQQAAIGALLLRRHRARPAARGARRGRAAPQERAPCRLRPSRPRDAPPARRRARRAPGARALGRWETLLVGLLLVPPRSRAR